MLSRYLGIVSFRHSSTGPSPPADLSTSCERARPALSLEIAGGGGTDGEYSQLVGGKLVGVKKTRPKSELSIAQSCGAMAFSVISALSW